MNDIEKKALALLNECGWYEALAKRGGKIVWENSDA